MKKLVMIDLETMGTSKNAAIIQIGAAEFRFTTPEFTGSLREFVLNRFCANVTLQSCIDAGLRVDESTREWWQLPENKEAFETTQEHAMPLRESLTQLRRWLLCDTNPEDIEPWANGTSFDMAILETAYRKLSLPMPWKYFNERDYRTMKTLWRSVEKPEFNGVKHSASDDAANQAVHLIAIVQHIDSAEQFLRHMTEGRAAKTVDTPYGVAVVDKPYGKAEGNKVEAPLEYGDGVAGE
jgi:hypothetical protein